ncbi:MULTISPECIES: 2-dehydropantoate 2-reductase [Paenibacillus]|uniref:ketopantoate reductase family protein n=1 Tax=Paenibacillus TaxID=44249 RepID=UPI002FE3D1ED
MKIEIIGAGALGLLFGGMLVHAGERVRFWTRTPEQSQFLNSGGFSIEYPGGAVRLAPGSFTAYPIDAAVKGEVGEAADWVFLMTKQRHIEGPLLRHTGKLLGETTGILCFQNGIGHIEKVRGAFPGFPVYAAITTEGAKLADKSKVIRSGAGVTKLGLPQAAEAYAKSVSSENRRENETRASHENVKTAECLAKKLTQAGFQAILSNDIDTEIYKKLLINAAINPLTALLRVSNGELLIGEERRQLLKQLCRETEQIYLAHGIPCEPDTYAMVMSVCRSTSGNISSMLKDVLQGEITEVDHINGRLVEMAHAAKIPAPGHEAVWRLVRALHPV